MAGSKAQAKGKANKVAGGVKKAAGKATKNRTLRAKGTVQDSAGKVLRKATK